MNGYNFTDRVRKVLQMAREEALRLQQDHVATEHILLGIIHDGGGVAVAVLINLNVDLEAIRQTIEKAAKKRGLPKPADADLPYTSRSKKVLELAMSEARRLNHSYVGTEHLLLGVIGEMNGLGAEALVDAGVTLEAARTEVQRLLGEQFPAAPVGFRQLRTTIALIELHRLQLGAYPDSLDDLQFLSESDRMALSGLRYEKVKDGYALEVVTPTGVKPKVHVPPGFWRGLGIKRTNVEGGPST